MATPYPRRRASHAGTWYADDPAALSAQLHGWLAAVPPPPPALHTGGPITMGIIAPHAGLRYSGATAAHSYAALAARLDAGPPVTRVLALGPSHHVHLSSLGVSGALELETPLGALPVDAASARELVAAGGGARFLTQEEDEAEHSLEMQLPYLAALLLRGGGARGGGGGAGDGAPVPLLAGATVLPVLVGGLSAPAEARWGAALARLMSDPGTFTVVSSDFCHYGARFRFTPALAPPPLHAAIEALDRQGMAAIEARDGGGFRAYLEGTRNTICGRHPISLALAALDALEGGSGGGGDGSGDGSSGGGGAPNRRRAAIRFVAYAQSSACVDASDSSVSYAAAVITAALSGGA